MKVISPITENYKSFFKRLYIETNIKISEGSVSLSELKKLFKENNKKFFNNKIQADLKISGDHFSSSLVLGAYVPNTQTIFINKNNLPLEAVNLILIHEMIHAYNIQVDGLDYTKDDIHGNLFMNKVREINSHSKYPVPYKEDFKSLEKVLDDLGY